MTEETRTEDMRYELGRDYAQQGKNLHEGASEDFVRGYSSYKGFGSNVSPKKFGQGLKYADTWTCVCGHENSSRIKRKVAGRIVCWQCGVERGLTELAES